MLTYYKGIDPTLKSCCSLYGDTDSIFVPAEAMKKLEALGYVKSREDISLGYLCNDIKKDGVIIYNKNLAPKAYRYESINAENKLAIKKDCVMKAKGIETKQLNIHFMMKQSLRRLSLIQA